MIPQFPQFKPVHLNDRAYIESFTVQHAPYSDFNFVSLWTWDTDGSAQTAQLNGNLVLHMLDYVTRKPFFSFLGVNDVHATVATLLDHAEENDVQRKLQLIPQTVIDEVEKLGHDLIVEEDEDNHDYILCVEKMKTMAGNKLGPKRNFINRYRRMYEEHTTVGELNIADPNVRHSILALFHLWEDQNGKDRKDTIDELMAITKLLDHADLIDLHVIGIFYKKQLIAFSIDEVTHDHHGIIHYEKANKEFVGLYPFLKQQTAHMLYERGCKYINYEQDLGVPGLKKAKKSFRPIHMLKKYTISKELA